MIRNGLVLVSVHGMNRASVGGVRILYKNRRGALRYHL